ncbi:MAG TPA: hypothetical protein VN495_00870 [Candidatus Paceibacterota bacterium]|nr:hypothetical protein [Candidatus Paceibacterota bacterium]
MKPNTWLQAAICTLVAALCIEIADHLTTSLGGSLPLRWLLFFVGSPAAGFLGSMLIDPRHLVAAFRRAWNKTMSWGLDLNMPYWRNVGALWLVVAAFVSSALLLAVVPVAYLWMAIERGSLLPSSLEEIATVAIVLLAVQLAIPSAIALFRPPSGRTSPVDLNEEAAEMLAEAKKINVFSALCCAGRVLYRAGKAAPYAIFMAILWCMFSLPIIAADVARWIRRNGPIIAAECKALAIMFIRELYEKRQKIAFISVMVGFAIGYLFGSWIIGGFVAFCAWTIGIKVIAERWLGIEPA